MKTKHKILTINLLVVFVSLLTVLTGIFSVAMRAFSSKDSTIGTISVAADTTMNFKKTGLLDLVGEGVVVDVSNTISIENKEDAVKFFNDYLNENFYSGKVKAYSTTLTTGGGQFQGIGATYYGFFKEEMSYKDGVFTNFNYYCKIPNSEGAETGLGSPKNFISLITIEDGVVTKQRIEGEKDVCYWIYENGSYTIIPQDREFTSTSVDTFLVDNDILPFIVSNETVSSVEIDASSSFIIKVKFNITNDALLSYRQDIKNADPGNKSLPNFTDLKFEVSFNKFTGEIIEISKYEAYTLQNQIEVTLTRGMNMVFKKED